MCFLILLKTGCLENLAILKICWFIKMTVCSMVIYKNVVFRWYQTFSEILLSCKSISFYFWAQKRAKLSHFQREKLTHEPLSVYICKNYCLRWLKLSNLLELSIKSEIKAKLKRYVVLWLNNEQNWLIRWKKYFQCCRISIFWQILIREYLKTWLAVICWKRKFFADSCC